MKRIEKTEKIWVPGEEAEEGYEPLLEGDEFNEPIVLELTKPILILETETPELIINPPTTDQMLDARAGKGTVQARSVKYFAQCCNIPLEAVKFLAARDFNRIGLVVANFTD